MPVSVAGYTKLWYKMVKVNSACKCGRLYKIVVQVPVSVAGYTKLVQNGKGQ